MQYAMYIEIFYQLILIYYFLRLIKYLKKDTLDLYNKKILT